MYIVQYLNPKIQKAMKKKYLKGFSFLLVFLFALTSFAQDKNSIWTKTTKESTSKKEKTIRKSEPKKADFYQLDLNSLKATLLNAPDRDIVQKSNLIIDFPLAGNKVESFRVTEASIMHPELQEKFPEIRSYAGQSVVNPSTLIRFSVTSQGLHLMMFSPDYGTQFIDPYTKNSNEYIVYAKRDLPALDTSWKCGVMEDDQGVEMKTLGDSYEMRDTGGGFIRNFRTVIACTIEYSQFHWQTAGLNGGSSVAAKKAAVMAAIVVTMTRNNFVYERDFSIRMTLVANNDAVVFIDSDNFTNNTAGTLINESQTVIDGAIGAANYDVGHTFSTGGGGLAQLNSPCTANKARGITGSGSPVGDPYDIDYVAHELGHQFGAPHSYNGNQGGCTTGTPSNAYEVGSGSTIMGYASLCGSDNVQGNSDPYFHQKSLRMIWDNVTGGNSTCANQSIPNNNAAPTAEAGNDFIIPMSTPYMLIGSSTDADGIGAHTYTWEQYDLGPAGQPANNTVTGPIVRSFEGTTRPTRYIPRLQDIVANGGVSTTWEKLSSVDRDINFELTVRDNGATGGRTANDNMKVDVETTAGPFIVTSQSTAVNWQVGGLETITWNVANTNTGTVNTPNVDILLSTDGGLTYPLTLATAVPNDGTHVITVPNVITGNCRVMVKGNGNIFFNISSINFSIIAPTNPTFTTTVPEVEKNQTICAGASPVVNIAYEVFAGFSENTVFSATGNPAGSNVNFSVNNINTTQPVVMTLVTTGAVTPGVYPVTITATSNSITRTEIVNFTVYSNTFTTPSLTFPSNGITGVGTVVTLTWGTDVNAESYDVQIATNSAFTTGLNTYNTTGNSYDLSGLAITTTYYWRVASKNRCGTGAYSGAYSFTTVTPNCVTYNSTQNNITIPATGANPHVITSTRNITLDEIITDLNVTINVQHVWAGDMELKLKSPAGTEVLLLKNSKCDLGIDDIGVTYDDEGIVLVCQPSLPGTPPSVGGTVIPESALSAFDGQSTMGDWVLTATDGFPSGDGGQFLNFSMQICAAPALSISEKTTNSFEMYPNPTSGRVTISFKTNEAVQVSLLDVRGRKVYAQQYNNNADVFTKEIDFGTMASGVYLLNVKSGNNTATKKLVIK